MKQLCLPHELLCRDILVHRTQDLRFSRLERKEATRAAALLHQPDQREILLFRKQPTTAPAPRIEGQFCLLDRQTKLTDLFFFIEGQLV